VPLQRSSSCAVEPQKHKEGAASPDAEDEADRHDLNQLRVRDPENSRGHVEGEADGRPKHNRGEQRIGDLNYHGFVALAGLTVAHSPRVGTADAPGTDPRWKCRSRPGAGGGLLASERVGAVSPEKVSE
jgi:hypothetical protein